MNHEFKPQSAFHSTICRFCGELPSAEIHDTTGTHDRGKDVTNYDAAPSECQCYYKEPDGVLGGEIVFCPLHLCSPAKEAAHKATGDALANICGFLNVTPLHLNEGDSITMSMLTDAARAALKLADDLNV